MNQGHYILIFLMTSFLLVACASKRNKQLDAHYQLLSQTATANIPANEKLDILGETLVQAMHEGLDITNPKKGADYVERFGDQNEDNIFKILEEVGEWQKNMSTAEKLGFGISFLQKPYVNDMIELAPRFKRKYDQIKFVSRFSKRLRNEITDFGMGKLTE